MKSEIQRVTVKALFVKKDAVFMLKSPDGSWELPGGKIQFRETTEDALRRELKEELGIIRFDIGPVVNIFNINTKFKNTSFQFIAIVYQCRGELLNLIISNEHVDSKWIDFSSLEKYPMHEGYMASIKKIFENDKVIV
jgi:8-oxo-dGTP diphosphatase